MYNIAINWNRDTLAIDNSSIDIIAVVGVGGTGSFVADSLARILMPGIDLVLIDMDKVEQRNLSRQSFTREDIGLFKSEALAKRLAAKYNRSIGYSILPIGLIKTHFKIIIGCVDNGLARRDIQDGIKDGCWWIDSGNGNNYGQVLIGNSKIKDLGVSFLGNICIRLPLPSIQQPGILTQYPRKESCNEAVATDDQGPTINQAMAVLVVEVVRRILEGKCPWMQLYLDLDVGTMTPTMASPETVSHITGKKLGKLIEKAP